MNRIYMAIALVAALVFLSAAVVHAQSVEIPLDTVHTGEPGDRFFEGELGTTQEIGWLCGATLDTRNNSSLHPDTNIIIESGANGVTFFDVELEAFDEKTLAFVIDGDIRVFTQIGGDGVSSLGSRLEFECHPPLDETTTTTTPDTPTTTTEPPPPLGVEAGGGSMATVVYGQDTDVLWFGAGVFFLVAAILGIAALAPRLRRNRRKP